MGSEFGFSRNLSPPEMLRSTQFKRFYGPSKKDYTFSAFDTIERLRKVQSGGLLMNHLYGFNWFSRLAISDLRRGN
jgi:hypothetical protein